MVNDLIVLTPLMDSLIMNNSFAWLIAALVWTVCWSGLASAQVELLDNGGFESGDFSAWDVSGGSGAVGCESGWTVSNTGGVAATGCQPGFSGTTPGSPNEGLFAAYNSFDGPGLVVFGLSQQIQVPGSVTSAILGWDETYNIDFNLGPDPILPRQFSVGVFDSSGTTLIENVFSESFIEVGGIFEQDWIRNSVDLTDLLARNAGNELTLRFENIIPEPFTGPGGFGLDDVSLTVDAIPEPNATLLLCIALNALAVRRRRG